MYTETAPQDRERDTNRGGILSMTIGSVLYIVAGISGYLLCGNGTEGNVLNSSMNTNILALLNYFTDPYSS